MVKPPIKIDISYFSDEQQESLMDIYNSSSRTQTFIEHFGKVKCKGGYIIEFVDPIFDTVHDEVTGKEHNVRVKGGFVRIVFDSKEDTVEIDFLSNKPKEITE